MAQLSWQKAATLLRQLHIHEYREEFRKLIEKYPISKTESYAKQYNALTYKATAVLIRRYPGTFSKLKAEVETEGFQVSGYYTPRTKHTVVTIELEGEYDETFMHKKLNKLFPEGTVTVKYRRRNNVSSRKSRPSSL
jgi:hypothetical protein